MDDTLLMSYVKFISRVEATAKCQRKEIHRRRLRERLDLFGFKEEDVKSDGNCQFHAVARQVTANTPNDWCTAASLRSMAVNWLRENRTWNPTGEDGAELHNFVAEDWDAYCVRMSRDGQWGDHVTLIAVAEVLNVGIRIISSVEGSQFMTEIDPSSSRRVGADPEDLSTSSLGRSRVLFLGHWSEFHYCSLVEEQGVAMSISSIPGRPAASASKEIPIRKPATAEGTKTRMNGSARGSKESLSSPAVEASSPSAGFEVLPGPGEKPTSSPPVVGKAVDFEAVLAKERQELEVEAQSRAEVEAEVARKAESEEKEVGVMMSALLRTCKVVVQDVDYDMKTILEIPEVFSSIGEFYQTIFAGLRRSIPDGLFFLLYKDNDGEMITIASEPDLGEFVEEVRNAEKAGCRLIELFVGTPEGEYEKYLRSAKALQRSDDLGDWVLVDPALPGNASVSVAAAKPGEKNSDECCESSAKVQDPPGTDAGTAGVPVKATAAPEVLDVDNELPTSIVFAMNLPENISAEQVRDFFSKAGKLIRIEMAERGWAYLEYKTQAEARNALRLSGKNLMGSTIGVQFARRIRPEV